MIIKRLNQEAMKEKILSLKKAGVAMEDVVACFGRTNTRPPCPLTIKKYYIMSEDNASCLSNPHEKRKAFDEPELREEIIKLLTLNGSSISKSSVYDFLWEAFIESGKMESLPGNEQTLRNFCRHLINTGVVKPPMTKKRIYNHQDPTEPGKDAQLDYGEWKLNDGTRIWFICIELTLSKFRFVKGQDHKFNGEETCRAIYAFFLVIGGRVLRLVIDQESCLVASEMYGEVVTTKVFTDFLEEQDIKLFVCNKADPESKGLSEVCVKFVKTNYLPSRSHMSQQEVIAGLPGWCHRVNYVRIHDATRLIPANEFKAVEEQALRPLLPSNYDAIWGLSDVVDVNKLHLIRFKANDYEMPWKYAYKKVVRTISNGRLLAYDTDQRTKLVAQYDLPDPSVKGQVFKTPGFAKPRNDEWKALGMEIQRKYGCASMEHFLNGLKKETDRSATSKYRAFLDFLEKEQPDMVRLEAVLKLCCKRYRYQLRQFLEIWEDYGFLTHKGAGSLATDEETSEALMKGVSVDIPPEALSVECRNGTYYEDMFNANVGKGGSNERK
ncbi:MAG TPA: hypothetical protein VJ869_05880 [Sphaerochaeta sp.]|nr:hypothetical protein [Sphaerochaeta sp.]